MIFCLPCMRPANLLVCLRNNMNLVLPLSVILLEFNGLHTTVNFDIKFFSLDNETGATITAAGLCKLLVVYFPT